MEKLGTNTRLLLDPDKLETNFNMTLKRFPLKEYNCSVTFLFSYFLNHSVVQKNLRICGKTCGKTWSYFWTMWGKEWSDLSTQLWLLVCFFPLFLYHDVISSLVCPQGMRKDRGRVLRREKRRACDRDKPAKDLPHTKAPPHDGRKHATSSSSTSGGGGRSSLNSIPPDQVRK